jgi:predicted enzyme related to lactoylglutathione lyase
MTDRKLLPGKFVWFELVGGDARKAQAFYGEVFGWKVRSFPMPGGSYDMIYVGDTMTGGYAPAVDARSGAHWLAYVSVEDVDLAARAAAAGGGKVAEAPHDIPSVGRRARVVDPKGAELGVFRSSGGDPPDSDAPQGGWCWNELHTPDPESALAFYEAVAGFAHRGVEMGPGGVYHIIARDGVDRGGASHMLPPGVAPHWLPYVRMSEVDATVARAKKLGAAVHMPAFDVPGVGRIGFFDDPQGARIAVIDPLPPQKS